MESAKKAVSVTKYFVSLPSSRVLLSTIILVAIAMGSLIGGAYAKKFSLDSIISGAGTSIFVIALPALFSAGILSITRRKVNLERALGVALVSSLCYGVFYLAAVVIHIDFAYVAFGISFLVWLIALKFAFGLARSGWLFALLQMILHLLSLLLASFLFSGALESFIIKAVLASFVFVFLLYALLFLISRPLKKNLGISSSDAISMFASQWLYQDKEIEEAFDEMGEMATTWIGIARFRTKQGVMDWVVPYFHFGPFGNLGGSEFSSKIEAGLQTQHDKCTFVFHGTATHDLDPVSSSSLQYVVGECKKAIEQLRLHPAHFSYRYANSRDSKCHLLNINDNAICSFTRAPLSTEDINLAVGWALMERASEGKEALVIDCHNCETGDVDYVEPGSQIALDMLDALCAAKENKKLSSSMQAGWAFEYPKHICGIASGGVKVACFDSSANSPIFYILLDSNSMVNAAREKIIESVRSRYPKTKAVEIFTTDTHELNAVKGVFNPAGEEDVEDLENLILLLCKKAHDNLSGAEFGIVKRRIRLKVLGPYQSSEIVSTFNAVFSLLKVGIPVGILAAVVAAMWLLSKV